MTLVNSPYQIATQCASDPAYNLGRLRVTDRTSRSKSQPKKARFEVFPKEERPKIGVEPQNPHLGEKHPNSPLDLMGDPFHLIK